MSNLALWRGDGRSSPIAMSSHPQPERRPLVKELWIRRVPQTLAVYFGAAWVVLEFTQFLESRYHIDVVVADVMLFIMTVVLPAVAVLAWTHGKVGDDPWGRLEIVTIAICGSIAVGGSIWIAWPTAPVAPSPPEPTKEESEPEPVVPPETTPPPKTESLARQILVRNERDDEAAKARQNPSRGCLLVFPFQGSLPPEQDWFRTELSRMLILTLFDVVDERNVPRVVMADETFGSRLHRQASTNDGSIPLGVRLSFARERKCGWMLGGEVVDDSNGRRIEVELTTVPAQGRRGNIVGTSTIPADRPLEAIDGLGAWIVQVLDANGESRVAAADVLTSDTEAFELYARAARYMNKPSREPTAGIPLLDEALERDPTFAFAAVLAGVMSQFSADQTKIGTYFEKALRHAARLPRSVQFTLSAGYFVQVGKWPEGLRAAERGLERDPGNYEVAFLVGIISEQLGDNARARMGYERALENRPGDVGMLTVLEKFDRLEGDDEGALEYARRRAELYPEDSQAWSNLGNALRAVGKPEEAREAYQESLLRQPNSVNTELQLIRVELDFGDSAKAIAQVREVYERTKVRAASVESRESAEFADYRRAIHGLATRLVELGRPAEAVEVLAPLLEQMKNGEMVRTTGPIRTLGWFQGNAAEAFGEAGMVDEAKAAIASVAGDDAVVVVARLRALIELGLAAEDQVLVNDSLARTSKLVRENPNRFAHMELAAVSKREKLLYKFLEQRWEEAIEQFEDPSTSVRTRVSLGGVAIQGYLELGRYAEARALLEPLLVPRPNDARVLLDLATAAHGEGKDDEARDKIGRVLEIWAEAEPGFRPLARARALAKTLGSP